jgi:hydrogenase nickel incorporation protein HypA/HybF
MHEWALADAVVASLLEALGGRPSRALRHAEVLLGELQAVDFEIFRFGLDTLLEQHGLDPGVVSMTVQPAEMVCRACSRRWTLEEPAVDSDQREAIHFLPEAAHSFLRCPSCGSADFSVEKGRGVSIAGIDLSGEEP